ncbi:MAG: dephospho-CoA kinase [Oscillospiraceae bacterium]
MEKKIRVVGLTGQTGAGKTEVSNIISLQGLDVINCDSVAHDVADKEKSCLADLALEFSILILNPNGTLNRKKLSSIVFGNAEKLKRLNEIMFPYIKAEIYKMIENMRLKGIPVVILDAPTLFESELNLDCDFIISVTAPTEVRVSRIVIRDRMTDTMARKRIASQHDDDFFAKNSDFVINNSGDLNDLKINTLEAMEKMCNTLGRSVKN